jgi:hypothetical protein
MHEGASLVGLPDNVERALSAFLTTTRESLSADLVSAVLFGSAAEGRLAPTSDVNLLLVLRAFVPERRRKPMPLRGCPRPACGRRRAVSSTNEMRARSAACAKGSGIGSGRRCALPRAASLAASPKMHRQLLRFLAWAGRVMMRSGPSRLPLRARPEK